MSFMLTVARKGKRTHTNVTIPNTQAAIVVDNVNRKSLIIQNQGSETVFLGKQGVAISGANRGYALAAGTSFTDDASDEAWWAISTSTNNILHVVEVS